MLSTTRVRVLVELAERGSFSAAADALDYTQSAVSKQVAALEREVGTQLVVQAVAAFRKRHPGIQLTLVEAGRDKLVEDVRAGELDLAAVFDFPALGLRVDEGLESRHLLDEPHDLLLPPDHRLARKRKVTMADLRDEDWLFPTLGPDSPTHK